MKRIWTWLVFPLLMLVIGFVGGAALTGRNYEKFVIDPARYEKANLAAARTNILSLLRINDVPSAIAIEEQMLDAETLVLTQRTRDPAALPAEVVRALKQVKTYREIYPPQGGNADQIRTALADIPRIENYKAECKGGLCRMVEMKKPEWFNPAAK